MFFLRKSSPFLLMIAVAAVAWRWHLTERFLEYDEIWTLKNFATQDIAKIFTDFATPNNHPFNTLWVKLAAEWSSRNWDIRLASLLFTFGAMILGGLTARRIFGKCAGLYTMAAMAFLPPFLAAGSTARGYAGQLFLLALFAYALLRCRKGNILWTLIAALAAVAATVALPSSILFLAPIGGFFFGTMLEKRKLCRVHLYAFGAAVAFALWWYNRNWLAFLETQKFSVPLNNRDDLLRWLSEVCAGNALLIPAMLAGIYFHRRRKMTWAVVLTVAFPLAAACISGAAPARVYLPCAAAAAILCAPATVRYRKTWFAIALAGQFILSLPVYPGDTVLENAVKYDSPGKITIFTPTDSYIIKYNYPELCQSIPRKMRRLESQREITLSLVKSPGMISGIAPDHSTVSWELPGAPPEQNGITTLPLRRSNIIVPGQVGFVILPPMVENNIKVAFYYLRGMEIINLNGWMSVPLSGQNGEKLHYMLLAVRSPEKRNLPNFIPLYTITD